MSSCFYSPALRLYQNGCFLDALFRLEKDAPTYHDFSSILFVTKLGSRNRETKVNWFRRGKCADVFWKHYLLKSRFLNDLLNDERIEEFLTPYFVNYTGQSLQLEQMLADKYPDSFVTVLRSTSSDLKSSSIEKLEWLEMHSCHQLRITYKALKHVRQLWERSIHAAEKVSAYIKPQPLWQTIVDLAIWIERKRLTENIDSTYERGCADVAAFFIKKETLKNISVEVPDSFTVNSYVIKVLKQYADSPNFLSSSDVAFLAWLSEWEFRHNILYTFSYDHNVEVSVDDIGNINLMTIDGKKYEAWKFDGLKLSMMIEYFRDESLITVNELVSEGVMILKGKTDVDKEINRHTTAVFLSCIEMANYYCMTSDRKSDHDIGIIESLATILNGFSANCATRYADPIEQYMINNSEKNWAEAILTNDFRQLMKTYLVGPVRDFDLAEFKQMVESNMHDKNLIKVNELVEFLLYKPGEEIPLHAVPFLQLGNVVMTFTGLLGRLVPEVSLIENLLAVKNNLRTDHVRQDEEKYFEEIVEKEFKEHNFPCCDVRVDLGDNETDVIVWDGETLLLMEVKRPRLRLDLKGRYQELAQIIRKASRQLTKRVAVASSAWEKLKNNKKLNIPLDASIPKVKTIIILPSFEWDHELINGHLKISWWELQQVLRRFKPESLKGLYSILEQNSFWEPAIKMLGLMGDKYGVQIRPQSEQDQLDLMNYNKAIALCDQKKYSEAIVELEKIINEQNKGADYYRSYGDALAAIGRWRESRIILEKAFLLAPNNAEVVNSLALTCQESGDIISFFKYMKLAGELAPKLFPVVKLYLIFEEMIRAHSLSPESASNIHDILYEN